MIYLLDKNGKEFAVAPSVTSYGLNFETLLIGIDENGVFYSSASTDCTERKYLSYIRISGFDKEFEIVGFDYKCNHYRLIEAGVAKKDVTRRLF